MSFDKRLKKIEKKIYIDQDIELMIFFSPSIMPYDENDPVEPEWEEALHLIFASEHTGSVIYELFKDRIYPPQWVLTFNENDTRRIVKGIKAKGG